MLVFVILKVIFFAVDGDRSFLLIFFVIGFHSAPIYS